MLDFRKGLLAIAVAGFGFAVSANAQVSCTNLTAPTVKTIRAEGVNEQLNPIALAAASCGATTTNTPTVTLTITTNATISNVAVTGTGVVPGSTDAQATFGGGGWGLGAGTATVQGVLINSTTMQFTYAPAAGVPNGSAAGSITINNLRVNASSLPVGQSVTVTPGNSTGLVFSAATAQVAAYTQSTLAPVTITGYTNVAICTTKAVDVNLVATAVIGENFATAFSTDTQETALETGAITGTINANTGVAIAAGVNPETAAGVTITGVRIAVTFGNLVTGVNYYVPTVITSGGLTLNLVATPSTPMGTVVAGGAIGATTSAGNIGANTNLPAGQSFAALNLTNGTAATIYYAVAADTAGFDATAAATGGAAPYAVTAAQLNLYEVVPATTLTAATASPSVVVTVAGNTAPIYTQFVAPTTAAIVAKNGQLTSCNTTILFPYLIQGLYGYTTGIDIANASIGTSNAANTVATQNGTCTLSLYGTVNGTAIPTATPITLKPGQITVAGSDPMTISAGSTGLFSLGSVPNGTGTLTGYLGYGVASCTFQEAHAFALTTDGIGDSNGYLGVLLQDVYAGAVASFNPTN